MRLSRVNLILMTLLIGSMISGHASVRSFDKLSLNEKMALEESERRLAVYDQQLLSLEHDRNTGRISKNSYHQETQQLTEIIREESLYQNAIIVRDPELPQRARDLFETLQHAVLAVPIGIGYVIGACPQLLQFLTLIH